MRYCRMTDASFMRQRALFTFFPRERCIFDAADVQDGCGDSKLTSLIACGVLLRRSLIRNATDFVRSGKGTDPCLGCHCKANKMRDDTSFRRSMRAESEHWPMRSDNNAMNSLEYSCMLCWTASSCEPMSVPKGNVLKKISSISSSNSSVQIERSALNPEKLSGGRKIYGRLASGIPRKEATRASRESLVCLVARNSPAKST